MEYNANTSKSLYWILFKIIKPIHRIIMEIKDVLSVLAVLLSPLIAIQTEKFIERTRSSKNRKVAIFKTLMATRGSKLSNDHVTALNQIDLEFHGKEKYRKTVNAWKEYFDQLNTPYEPEGYNNWSDKVNDLLVNLLYEMGIPLGFSFDKVTIKRNIYSPSGHIKVENQNQHIRELLIKVLSGENSIATYPILDDETFAANIKAGEKTSELQTLLIEHYKNGTPINVVVTKKE